MQTNRDIEKFIRENIEEHKKAYEASDKAISLEHIKSICTTPKSQELLETLIKSCKEYYKSIHVLQKYITDNKFDFEYNNKVNDLALAQSIIHDVVMKKLKTLAEELNDKNLKTVVDDRMTVGEFAALTGEMES